MNNMMQSLIVPVLYLVSAVMFIFGLKGLTRVRTARRGNALASFAMLLAIVTTLLDLGLVDYRWIITGLVVGGLIGAVAALKVEMTAMPEMVALFNGFGGGASALVALSILWADLIEKGEPGTATGLIGADASISAALSVLIGSVTITGSLVAFLKLSGRNRP